MKIHLFLTAIISAIIASITASGASSQNSAENLEEIEKVAESGPFQPDWDSLAKYEIPTWYKDAKFGLFIHWGVFSVPAFGSEWYPREMYRSKDSQKDIFEHHKETWGPVDEFGYKDFIPMFKAERFDPEAWAELFKASGAKYIIPVAEHHDGFPMYDSEYTKWSAAKMGPKRDIIAELAKAVRDEDLIFGVSSHRAENWWFYGGGREIPSDVQDERYRALYGPAQDRDASEAGKTPPDKAFLDDWLLRCAELVDKFEPRIIWFDWWMAQPAFHQHLQTFSAYYYNRGKTWPEMVAINYKKHGGESYPDTAGVLDIERGQLAQTRELFWQTDTSVAKNSWGYTTDQQYKTVDSLVDDLIDIVSKNGSLLLNIGPRPDGTIPEEEQRMLREIGAWLDVNGEAIYGTRPWVTFGEGPTEVIEGTFAEKKRKDFSAKDIRFTTKENALYAIVLDWPGDGREISIESINAENLPHKIAEIKLIGSSEAVKFDQATDKLQITLPDQPAGVEHAFVLRISTEG